MSLVTKKRKGKTLSSWHPCPHFLFLRGKDLQLSWLILNYMLRLLLLNFSAWGGFYGLPSVEVRLSFFWTAFHLQPTPPLRSSSCPTPWWLSPSPLRLHYFDSNYWDLCDRVCWLMFPSSSLESVSLSLLASPTPMWLVGNLGPTEGHAARWGPAPASLGSLPNEASLCLWEDLAFGLSIFLSGEREHLFPP